MLCHRLVYGLPSTEYIALEDGEGEIRRNEEEERDEGMKAKKEGPKIEKERKTMQLTAGVCSPSSFAPLLFSLVSPFSPFRRDFIQRDHPGTRSRGPLFVLSHSPRSGEHELPYSDATSEEST